MDIFSLAEARFPEYPILLNGLPAPFELCHGDVAVMRFGHYRAWLGQVQVLGPNAYRGILAKVEPSPLPGDEFWPLGSEVTFTGTSIFEVYREPVV